jgi:hypothetical protein
MATVTRLRLKSALLGRVAQEAQKAGDDRWNKAAEQQRRVNARLLPLLRKLRKVRGQPEPEPVRVGMRTVPMRARRRLPGGPEPITAEQFRAMRGEGE